MKYRVGDIYVGKDDVLRVPATSMRYSPNTYNSIGLISGVGDIMGFHHYTWDDKWTLQDIYILGFPAATLNPMQITLDLWYGTIGEPYNNHAVNNYVFSLGSVVNTIIQKNSILSLLAAVGNLDSVLYTLAYNATLGEETNYYVSGIIQEYKLR